MKAEVADLQKDVDYLKFTDFISLLEAADDVDTPETFVIPLDTTGDVHRDGIVADESEAKIDEEQIEVQEEIIYGDLLDLDETIVQSVIHTLLTETSMEAPSGSSTVDVTPGTEAQDQSDAPSTDAQTDGATV
uniref:Polyprotein protein n=1 Tax=Solanum tuberosum TaxID=4113 RepID=M1D9I9_SOLTU